MFIRDIGLYFFLSLCYLWLSYQGSAGLKRVWKCSTLLIIWWKVWEGLDQFLFSNFCQESPLKPSGLQLSFVERFLFTINTFNISLQELQVPPAVPLKCGCSDLLIHWSSSELVVMNCFCLSGKSLLFLLGSFLFPALSSEATIFLPSAIQGVC